MALTLQDVFTWFSSNEEDLDEVLTMYDRASAARQASRDKAFAEERWTGVSDLLRLRHSAKSFVCSTLERYIQDVGSGAVAGGVAGGAGGADSQSVLEAISKVEKKLDAYPEAISKVEKKLDAYHSVTRNASAISVSDFSRLLEMLRIGIQEVDDQGIPLDVGSEEEEKVAPQKAARAVGAKCARPDSNKALQFLHRSGTRKRFWDHRPEIDRYSECAKHFSKFIPEILKRKITYDIVTNIIREEDDALPFPISGKNDIVWRIRSLASLGYLLGLEIKKVVDISRQYHQTFAEWLLYSCHSMFPFVQVYCDMETGGYAFYLKGKDGHGNVFVCCRILDTMEKVENFIQSYFNQLPGDIAEDKGQYLSVPTALTYPPCCQFSLVHSHVTDKAGQTRSSWVVNMCENILGMWSEQDLTGFSDSDHPSPKPSPGGEALPYFN